MSELKVGLKASAEIVVTEADLASKIASGEIDVYATPKMIALMEKAASDAVAPALEAGQVTVGTSLNVTHDAATPLGMKVRAEAELVEIKGKALTFKVEAFDEKELIGKGEHHRYIVDVEKFMQRVNNK